MSKLSLEAKLRVWEDLETLQEAFPYTVEGLLSFAQVCIKGLIPGRPDLNAAQADILEYMLTGKKYRMVQAQRSQAKTTLAGIFAAFTLIHMPHYRIVIFSQTAKRATEISGWVTCCTCTTWAAGMRFYYTDPDTAGFIGAVYTGAAWRDFGALAA